MIDYLTMSEVLAMHADLIDRYGGSHGVRDMGLLEAALFRPQTGYYADIVEQAAALWESIAQNHPFIDGNKRIAFTAADVFLRHNGFYLEVEGEDGHAFVDGSIARQEFRFAQILVWIRQHLKPVSRET